MTTTLTIRLPTRQREALRRRALALKKTESALVRELVEREIAEVSFGERIGGWAESVESSAGGSAAPDAWREKLRERNWRPA